MRRIGMILGLVAVMASALSVWAQGTGQIPVPVFTEAEVQATATFDSGTGLYSYAYTITNPATNTGEIFAIDIDISQPPDSVTLSGDGLMIPFGFITSTFDDALADFGGDVVPMIPVGIQVPLGWGGDLGARGDAGFSSGALPNNILPGETLGGHQLISRGLPTIREAELQPWWLFVKSGNLSEEDSARGREIEQSLIFRTQTLGPTAPPERFIPRDFVETIRGYVNQSVTLVWLNDPALATALGAELDTTASFIEANDPSAAKEALQRFMTAIDQASAAQRTTEALGLLFFNAKFLFDKLPDTFIPPPPAITSLDLSPLEVTLPVGAAHTLSAIFVADDETGGPGAPVLFEVTEGPNAGLLLPATTDDTGKAEVLYTSLAVGIDRWVARVEEIPDFFPGAISEPVTVEWSGGPDLVIELFLPPQIKSEGGEPIFITEITRNQGSTPAEPSFTAYFLSEDPIINPDEDQPIGDRSIPSLASEESSDGGTVQLQLPAGLPQGTYFVGAFVDIDDDIVELNEENNCEMNPFQLSGIVESAAAEPPDCEQAVASRDLLWPPNHKLIPLSVEGISDPSGGSVVVTITQITQDEPVNGLGDGDTSPDGFGVGTNQAQLRAERSGTGNGRVYAIGFSAAGSQGSECSGSVQVGVPHDKGKGAIPIDDGQIFDSTQP